MIIFFLAQVAVAPPPPPPRPNADFSCRLFDDRQRQSNLTGSVRLDGARYGNQVKVEVTAESSDLPAVSRYESQVYGNLFDARFFSATRDVHYKFQMPQTYGKNGTVQILDIRKSPDGGSATTAWVATGICEFAMKALP